MADGKGMSIMETLRARLTAAKAEAERERLTPEEQEAAKILSEAVTYEATAREKRREEAMFRLQLREQEAAARLGPKVPVDGILSEDGAHAFVIKYPGSRAFSSWENANQLAVLGMKDPKSRKPVSREDANRAFAMLAIVDWNGEIIEPNTDAYARLERHLTEYAGTASSIALAARGLSGAAMEGRKSGG
jgi:hypothetical protein